VDELVKGVLLQNAGEALERVDALGVQYHLLASWDGTEVIRQIFPAGRMFGLRPEAGWEALECMYLLQGTAIWENRRRTVTLGPGDSLSGRPVQEPCILTAVTDLVVLYVCSRPSFHLMSGELDNLLKVAVAVEEKDGYTVEHCQRIQTFSAMVGKQLGLDPTRQHNLLYGSVLHDLGKVGVPDGILKKPGKLTAEEWAVMQRHTLIGRDMLINTCFAAASPILEQHHERRDGSGYPRGLSGDEICLEAQIVAVVDSFDAMTTDRVYRPALPPEEVIAELKRGAGRTYHSDVVEAFLPMIPNLIA
jgi:HD-GYP domain-containing protein (c-di-GMP phosphodiesterase class II)